MKSQHRRISSVKTTTTIWDPKRSQRSLYQGSSDMIDIHEVGVDDENASPRTLRHNNESGLNLSLSVTEHAQSNQVRLEADRLVLSYQQ